MQRLLNVLDYVVDFFTLGEYGVEPDEWPVIDDTDEPTDWCDWTWV